MKSWTEKLDAGAAVIKPSPRSVGDVIKAGAALLSEQRLGEGL